MATISIRELHERTYEWVRRAAEPEGITDRGPLVAPLKPRPNAAATRSATNRFLNRKLRLDFAELQARLIGGTESHQTISEDRDRA